MLLSRVFLIFVVSFASSFLMADTPLVFRVVPPGLDTSLEPEAGRTFSSLEKARDAIRSIGPASEDIEVRIASGLHFIEETLLLDQRDSPAPGHRVFFRAEDPSNPPRISAGRMISGSWQDEGNGIMSIDVGEGDFRQLYVNGTLATTAREPDLGEWSQLKQWEPISHTIRLEGSGILDHWERMEQVEFVVKKHWGISRHHIEWWGTYDGDDVFKPKGHELEFVTAHVPPKAPGQYYFFENALEFLDQPGEWYLDRTSRRLFYMPRPGEDLNQAEIIAPRLERAIELQGASNITFDGLVFEHTNWLYPNGDTGYVGCQANVHWDGWNVNPGAIHLSDTQDVEFKNCVIRNTTSAGLVLVKGTRRTLVEGNVFQTIGDTPIAVYAEKDREPKPEDQCIDDVIRNNLVENFGTHNFATSGICVAVATRATVEHNEVRRGGYAGITYGYFSTHYSPATGSRVQYNHVHDVMRELDDGAGIYIFTTKFHRSDSTLLVYRNFVHDVYRGETAEANPVAGIYLDEGAAGVTLRENVIRSVGNSIHLNTGNSGKPNETKRSEQSYEGNTDEQAEWEAAAGLQPDFAHLDPAPDKPKPVFEQAELLHHWPLDGDLNDMVTGSKGRLIGGAAFSKTGSLLGTTALQLNRKGQWADLGAIQWPDRFTVSLFVKLPEDAFGERALFSTPGLRVYSGVDIGDFREDLRTTTSSPGKTDCPISRSGNTA